MTSNRPARMTRLLSPFASMKSCLVMASGSMWCSRKGRMNAYIGKCIACYCLSHDSDIKSDKELNWKNKEMIITIVIKLTNKYHTHT